MSKQLQELTDFILKQMAQRGEKVDGHKMYQVLKEATIEVSAIKDIDRRMWDDFDDVLRKDLGDMAKEEIYELLWSENPTRPLVEVTSSYALNDVDNHGYFVRRYSASMLFIRKDLK